MRNIHDNIWVPEQGYKYISNGEVWATEIALGKSDSIENWHDTNEEPPDPVPEDEEATPEDYEAALSELGVN